MRNQRNPMPGPPAQDVDEPLAMLRSSATSYYQADGLGSVTSLSDTAGSLAQTYTLDSFGRQTASSGSIVNPFQYTGREWDAETSLYNYRLRYYSPALGRFISEDPTYFGSGNNFYSYVENRPTMMIDPSGLADVYIWSYTGSGGNWGHASLMLNDGTYISWWPGEPRDGKMPNGKIPDLYSAPALPPDLARDQELEGTTPTIIHLDNLDEDAIKKWWNKFRQKNKWKTLSQNCSTTVARALDAGGGRRRAPFAPHHFVWTPADVEDYAQQIKAAGQGQNLPIWITH